jgi:hypothetical protein
MNITGFDLTRMAGLFLENIECQIGARALQHIKQKGVFSGRSPAAGRQRCAVERIIDKGRNASEYCTGNR